MVDYHQVLSLFQEGKRISEIILLMLNFLERMGFARKKRGLKQIEITVDAGINPGYYGKIERGIVNPSIEKLFRIIKSLKVKSYYTLPF